MKKLKNIACIKWMYTYPSFNKVLSPYIDYGTSNSLGRVEAECMILIPFPWIEYSLSVNSTFINGSWDCDIN